MLRGKLLTLLACLALVFMPVAIASAQLTYILEEYIANDSCGGCDVGVVGGTITTDGTLGDIGLANILSVDPIMVKSKSGTFMGQSNAEVLVDLNADYSQDNSGLTATPFQLFLDTDDAFKAFGAGDPSTRDLIEWINQEGTGDPGRRVQLRYDGQFGQHRRPETSGPLLVATRIPEPASAMLLMLALGVLTVVRRRSI